MDYALPEDAKLLQMNVRKFVYEELIPLERELPETEHVDDIPGPIRERLQRRTREMGLWLLGVPEEYGGPGLSMLELCVVWQETSKAAILPNRGESIFGPDPGPILFECNEEQRPRFLQPVLQGEKRTCFAQTEPDAGSDPAGMKTRAVKEGDHWVLNGRKRFITNAHKADFAQVFAVTDPQKRARGGITCFLVDMKAPGVKLEKCWDLMMADRPGEISFQDVQVPETDVLGGVGRGFQLGQKWISVGRLHQCAKALGIAERSLEMAARYAKIRVTFGQPLAERQAVQWMLADSYVEMHATRLMLYEAAWKHDQGQDIRTEAYMAKLYGVEMVNRVVDRAIQIHGGIGLSREL
ncbi:MAG: acyl-CoA dehydrogenase family protein, partial [Deltaproteobacteria bacterium]|nr:acyl-CoA dehydrogenase family protein [Deltaproteobacteria bacterium]